MMKSPVFFKALLVGGLVLTLAGGCGNFPLDYEHFDDFITQEFPMDENSTLTNEIDLYVDYSTCVAEASGSEFYKATHPAIVDCNPNYYSIKGKSIKLETSDRDEVYRLLRSIKEVNNANLKQAVADITSSDHQAVIITDGEYYPDNVVKDNLDNPYLAPYLRKWMQAGRDIYIYSEPYLESGKHNKFRYYIIFTDNKIQDNLNEKFVRSAPDMESVLVLHLYSGVPGLSFSKKFPDINPTLSAIESPVKNSVFIDVQLGWDDIQKYMMTGDLEQDYILRGMKLDIKKEDCYRIKEVEPVVYQLYKPYAEYADSASIKTNRPKFEKDDFEEVDDLFEIDSKAFKKNNEIVLKFDSGFDYKELSSNHENLFKIDFVVEDAEDNFSGNDEISCGFIWNSISKAQNHDKNTSLYQSISQVLREPRMNPKKEHKVIYTVYVKTPAFK